MDSIPNVPSWDFVYGFLAGEAIVIILWFVVEWIAKGKRMDDDE